MSNEYIIDPEERAALLKQHLGHLIDMQKKLEEMSVELSEKLNFNMVYQDALVGLGRSACHLKLELRALGLPKILVIEEEI